MNSDNKESAESVSEIALNDTLERLSILKAAYRALQEAQAETQKAYIRARTDGLRSLMKASDRYIDLCRNNAGQLEKSIAAIEYRNTVNVFSEIFKDTQRCNFKIPDHIEKDIEYLKRSFFVAGPGPGRL